ncbi:unnamed protein product [Caenorhabditis bovis]|uniref:Vacuolar protein sorting-associated protein 8 central domain-containing protein n=1 Tax=Caenorhabditis bovis TaxID=2654633 RepID=A0A8S1ES31_9PELO|nr:unnamed protein product [Caenorhabditis bovis]
MSSSRGSASYDPEDWLDIGDGASIPSLALDDVLNEIEHLDEGLSFTDETIVDGDVSPIPEISSEPSALSYQLDSAVVVHSHHSISHQIASLKSKSGNPVAIAERNGIIAVGTSRGHLLLFDLDGKLDRYHQSDSAMGSASCVAFSLDGKHITIGYSKGAVKIISVRTGTVHHLIPEGGQPGLGILQILYIADSSSFLTLDTGGSVYEIRVRTKITRKKDYSIKCIFSGCNGEVINIRLLPNSMLALLTVSKLLLVSTRFGGSILGAFPLNHSYTCPPLFAYWLGGHAQPSSPLKSLTARSLRDLKVCISRGIEMVIFRLHVANFGTKHKSATLHRKIRLPVPMVNLHWTTAHLIVGIDEHGSVWQIETEKGKCEKAMVDQLELIFATSDYKGLATGGRVSEAMCCIAEMACFQSITNATSTSHRFIVLAHDGLKIIEKVSDWEQLERFRERDDEISAALFLLDVVRKKVKASESFNDEASEQLRHSVYKLLDITMNGYREGRVAQLAAHYKKYIRILLHVCITGKMFDILYDDVWNRVSADLISRNILLESIDEYVLDGALVEPPPTIVSDYLQYLSSEGHFSQFQAAVVRFPIHSIDLHSVMSICRQNGLYDGIIYVMNNALNDYISPLEEMLNAIREFASHEVLTDNQVGAGNRLLVYLQCCLAGRGYPYGTINDPHVPLEVYRCICSLKGKDGSGSEESYPNLRLLLDFDAESFVQLITTCADETLFQTDGRLQRITDTIGLVCVAMRKESPLSHFLRLVVQLTERSLIVPPVELVHDAIISLLRIATWQHVSTESSILSALRAVTNLDRNLILRAAHSPMRASICTLIYLGERKFVELIECYILSNQLKSSEVFASITQILEKCDMDSEEAKRFNEYVRKILPTLIRIDARKSARLIIDNFADYMKKIAGDSHRMSNFDVINAIMLIRREQKQMFICSDEELDEKLFGIVFEGICKKWIRIANIDEHLMDLLAFWLPTGSRNDFCLNQAVANGECVRTVVCLLEARQHTQRAFEVLFEQLVKFAGFDDAQIVFWLDELLAFCSRHSKIANEWLLRVFRFIAAQSEASTLPNIKARLHSLTMRIIESGTEHAAQLLESLLECPSFADSAHSEHQELLHFIFTSCNYENTLLANLLNVVNSESSEYNRILESQIGLRGELIVDHQCATCSGPFNKSVYAFRCGHLMHIECVNSNRKICECEDLEDHEPLRLLPRQLPPNRPPKKDIFAEWNNPLDLKPANSADDDYPRVAPFLSTEGLLNCPVERPVFIFSPTAYHNIRLIENCKRIFERLDFLILKNNLHRFPCLILQAGSQATMRLACKFRLRADWNTTVEIPFCLYITQNGCCSRELDFEDLDKQEKWFLILEEVLAPFDRLEHRYYPIIAPHQMNKVVKDILSKSKVSPKPSSVMSEEISDYDSPNSDSS